MKLLAIFILHKVNESDVKILQNEFNLDHISMFQRRHVRSVLIFTARTAVQRTDRGMKQSIDSGEDLKAMAHVYVRSDGLAAAVVSDDEYPKRVAHNLLSKVMDNFTTVYPSTSWNSMAEGTGQLTTLNETFMKYQNPQEADPFMSLQKDLDDTKQILVRSIDGLLQRGENLDALLAKSGDLSDDTKALFITSKQMNPRCCGLF